MPSDLDTELQGLVIENWGLVHELYTRAVRVRDEVNEMVRRDLGQVIDVKDANIVKNSANLYVSLPGGGYDYLSYVQIEIVKDEPRPTARVFTAFRNPKGIGTAELKRAVAQKLGPQTEVELSESGVNCEMCSKSIELRSPDLKSFAGQVVDEVRRQFAIAEVLRSELRIRLEKSAQELAAAHGSE
jgi:hypothetical protein